LLDLSYTQALRNSSYDPVGTPAVGITQFLELAGVPSARRRSARAEVRATEADREATARELEWNVRESFVRLAASYEREQVERDSIDDLERASRLVHSRVSSGIAPHYDASRILIAVEQAQADLNDAQASTIRARGDFDIAVGPTAAELQGVPNVDIRDVPAPPPLESAFEVVKNRRPDLLAARYRVAVANTEVDIARRSVFPGVALRLGAGYGQSTGQFDVGAGLTIPLPILERIWWKCTKGPDHEWCVAVHQRTTRGRGCPFCRNRLVSVTNSLASLAPEVARQWHPTRNGTLTPDRVVVQSQKQAWWQCAVDGSHVWRARLSNRWWLDAGCPFCSGQRVTAENALASKFPSVAKEWDRERNGKLSPRKVAWRSHLRVSWRCPFDRSHRWRARIDDRTGPKAPGCPVCAGKAPVPRGATKGRRNALATTFPALLKEWDGERNKRVTPKEVTFGSHIKVWWRSLKDPAHRWRACVGDRTRGTGARTAPASARKKRQSSRSLPRSSDRDGCKANGARTQGRGFTPAFSWPSERFHLRFLFWGRSRRQTGLTRGSA
jgi:Probable Zinc-ribbon domain/Outer membrane efflux protein